MLTLAVLALLALSSSTEAARILALFPTFAPSHHTILRPIMKALALAGHEVVVYTAYPLENPPANYTNVVIKMDVPIDKLNTFIETAAKTPQYKCLDLMLPSHDFILPQFFNNDAVQKLLHSNEKFDVVFTETFLAQEYTLYFATKFKAPSIGVQTYCTSPLLSWHMGNTLSLTSIPDACFQHSNRMSFWERFLNAYSIIRGFYVYFNEYIPMVERKFRKYVPDSPPLTEMTMNLSLMFTNDHLTADYARARPPNMITISGIHLAEQKKPIPQNIKTFMDEAPHGVILFSLGTLVPEDTKPKEYFDLFINVFKRFPQRVLWKTKKTSLEGLPSNVMLVNWMPQEDVLAHPNLVLFITHGGIASQIETINAGVPVVGIPYFADQHRNVGFYHAEEIGVRVLPDDLSAETLAVAIRKVLSDPKYKRNMQKMSRIFRDRPMSPAQSVVYWTEYVIRHKGAHHLKPASSLLSWYQVYLLDVLAAILAVFLSAAVLLFILVRKILFSLRSKTNTNPSTDKKTN